MREYLVEGPTELRRWRVRDAEALDTALRANVEHLTPFMAWMRNEPIPIDARRAQLAVWEQRWDANEKYGWGIYTDGACIGACDLERDEEPDTWNIGYWIAFAHLGQGHAARSGRLITDAAFTDLRARRVIGVCDAANTSSNTVLQRLGFSRAREFTGDIFAPGETGRVRVYERTTPIAGSATHRS